MTKIFKISIVFCLTAMAFGCAGGLKYEALESHMSADSCTSAVNYVEKNKGDYGSNRKLLYLLDVASINMLCGNYKKSNRYFHDAETLAENLWTKSISREAASFLINDYTITYGGEDFERALINLLSAINYALLGEYDEALVEVKRLDSLLSIYNVKYDKKNIYKEDAFARYLSGMIYESIGDMDDAYIDYYKAYQIFTNDYEINYSVPVPGILLKDLKRIAQATGRIEDVKALGSKRFAKWGNSKQNDKSRFGKVVLIHFNGKSPEKVEDKLYIPTKNGPITLAFPRYRVNKHPCKSSKLVIESASKKMEVQTELVEDVTKIAVKNLADRKVRIVAKAIARAIAKQVVVGVAASAIKDKTTRHAAKFLFNIVNTAIERADTRSWRTLPGEIYLASMFLSEGEYDARVKFCRGDEKNLNPVSVSSGKTTFLLVETMYE